MAKGGNAIDAAIATILCDGVVCPHQMGVGGGFIMSFYNAKTKKVTSINARETAPAAATTNMFVNDPMSSINGMYYCIYCYRCNLGIGWGTSSYFFEIVNLISSDMTVCLFIT